MKKKSEKVLEFLRGLHEHIIKDPLFRKVTAKKRESEIHTELRSMIDRYLENYFEKEGFVHARNKAINSHYWEGQEKKFKKEKPAVFGTKNYPDFYITEPYLVAIEYKKGSCGAAVKQGIGQSMMHTLCGEFDYVYFLFQDESKEQKILNSIVKSPESEIIKGVWENYNVCVGFAGKP
jgi:hypothetical protein